MSERYIEESFPLAQHPKADVIREMVRRSLATEDVPDEDGPLYYTRFDWTAMSDALWGRYISLTPDEESALIAFGSEYASLVDQEEDEMDVMSRKGENDE